MIVALCPSRGRPAAASATLASFLATKAAPDTRLLFLVDSDDPTLADYPAVYTTAVEPRGTMAGALAQGLALIGDATAVGMIGDDNRFRTPGWDVRLDSWLTANVGVAFGDDGHQDEILAARGYRLPTSWWLSRPVADAFGMTLAGLNHYWMDNYWLDLAGAAGALEFMPDVLIEHLNPLWQTADEDATYARAARHAAHDKAVFRRWRGSQAFQRHLAVLRRLRGRQPAIARPVRVLADWHHPGLWESLEILFGDRFGWELYAPRGMAWAEAGFWRFTHQDWAAPAYLIVQAAERDGYAEAPVPEYPSRPRRVVTLEQADALRPDIVLASVPAHDASFRRLADRWGARYVYQMGNARQPTSRLADLTLASVITPKRPKTIRYHQEFSLETFAFAAPPPPGAKPAIGSFMLRLPTASCAYQWLAQDADVAWRDYGGADPRSGGYLAPMTAVAAAMRDCAWIWHDKRIGDGYGHVVHNAAAMGRPLIGHAAHYRGRMAGAYWRDLETCIDLDKHSPAVAARLIRGISAQPEWLAEFGQAIRATFDREVDFAAEASEIAQALA